MIRQISDRIAVMYLGRIVELVDSESAVHPPATSVHREPALGRAPRERRGGPEARSASCSAATCPRPVAPPSGCAFHPRCPKARLLTGGNGVPEDCRDDLPVLQEEGGSEPHAVACWHPLASAG